MTEGRHTARLVLAGHIIDSMMLPSVMDLVMDEGGNFTIEELKVGQHKTDTSLCPASAWDLARRLRTRRTSFILLAGPTISDPAVPRWPRTRASTLSPCACPMTANLSSSLTNMGRMSGSSIARPGN